MGAGSLSLSGKFIWKSADDDDDDDDNDPDDAVPSDKNEGDNGGEGGTGGKDDNDDTIGYAKAKAKGSVVGPAAVKGGKPFTGEETCLLYTSPSPRD